MKKIASNILWAITTLFIVMILFSSAFTPGEKPESITLSQLAQKISNNEVASIIVSGEELSITGKDNKKYVAQKEAEAGLSETLRNFGVNEAELQTVTVEIKNPSGFRFWATLLLPTLLPILAILGIFWFISRQARSAGSQAFTFGRSNIRLFGSFKNRVTFADVAGLKETKKELEEVVDFLKNPKKYLSIGAQIPRGVLLMGAPGTGKTLLARAVAGEAGVPFFHISASEFVEMFVGVGASRTRDAFATAKKAAPSILFIDEIDAIGRERGTGLGGGHDEREQTLNQILVEMDGFERDTQVIVLAATNRPDILDAALLRPGRFDRRVFLDLPDIKDREEILKIHSKNKKVDETIDYKKIAVRTPGFSGADLANLMNEAAIFAASKNKETIAQEDVYGSIEKVLLGPERRGRTISDKEKRITAYHEAGHALVGASLKDSDPVHKVSIISRGRAGGYTLKLPTEEVYLKTRSQYLADLAVAMGGFAAEKEVFSDDMTSGASNDIKEASALARRLITRFGMSDSLGPVAYGNTDEHLILGRGLMVEKNYSETTATHIDKETHHLIDNALKKARAIIQKSRGALDAIANALMEKESLEQEEFYKILEPFKIEPQAA